MTIKNQRNTLAILAGYLPLMIIPLLIIGFAACDGAASKIGVPGGSETSNFDDDDDDQPTGPQTIEEIIAACGVSQEMLDDPDAVIFQKKTKSWPKVFTGSQGGITSIFVGVVNYRVAVTTVIDIKSTMGGTTTSTDFEIDATPSLAESKAEEEVAPFRGYTKAYGVSMDTRMEIADEADEWSGIFCTLQPTQRIRSSVGGHSKIIEYSPAITTSVSPFANAERYESEIGSGKTFTDIEAKVVESSDPSLPTGKVLKGTVTVTPVDPMLVIQPTGGQPIQIPSDRAYKITTDFGSVAKTSALGLYPSQTFYISNAKKQFEAIVAESGSETSGTVVLSPYFSQ